MIKKLSGLTAALFLCANISTAQVANYTFSQSIGGYGATNTGTAIGSAFQDDEVNTVTLPFSFTYNGTSYNSVDVSSNGCISFSAIGATDWNPVSDNGTQEVISAFGFDLGAGVIFMGDVTAGSNTITNCSFTSGLAVGDVIDNFYLDFAANPVITAIVGSNIVVNINALNTNLGSYQGVYGEILHSESGTAPNRVVTFEFRHFSRLIEDELLDFKINLYETTNRIEVVYGNMYSYPDPLALTGHEVGLKGLTNSDFNTREVTSPNTWSASNASSTIFDVCEFSPSIAPAMGQTYAWTPQNCVTPTLTVSQSPTLTCPSASVVLTASGATSYTWSGGPSTSQYTVTPLLTTSYTLTGADGACSSTLVVTHSVIPGATIAITQSSSQICAGASATLTASGAASYSWTNGPSTAQYVVTPGVTTTYTVSGSNGGSCIAVAFITQTVNPYPVLGITQSSATICQGQTAVITATGATTYAWGSGQTTAQISVTPSATAVYIVSGTTAGCTSTASITQNVTICTGLEDVSLVNITSVFPNPFRSELNLNNGGAADVTVIISDALGKTIYTTTVRGNSNERIQTEFLVNGIYLLKLNDGTNTITKKIVKN